MKKQLHAMVFCFVMALDVGSSGAMSRPAPPGEPLRSPIESPMAMFFCTACEDGCSNNGHIATVGGTSSAGHGSHVICWTGQSCMDSGHEGGCETAPVPIADYRDLLESARLVALGKGPASMAALPDDYAFYVSFNVNRGAVQVKACDGQTIIANFPAVWADSLGTTTQ